MSYWRDKKILDTLKVYYEAKLNLINSFNKHLEKKGNLSEKQLDLVKRIYKSIKDE